MMVLGMWLLMAICMLLSFPALSGADPEGFVSIDCGIETNTLYVDSFTGLTYVSDDHYTDAGENHNVASNYNTEYNQYLSLLTLRSFPNNTRNCYTLPSVKGWKYLVRATFYYGNYDRLSKNHSFDLYYGVNFWTTVVADLNYYYPLEIIAVAATNYTQVCLVNTGKGTPFISVLELRPLNNTLYNLAHSKQSLILWHLRRNIGAANDTIIRYPKDPHDRLWFGWLASTWKNISTTTTIQSSVLDIPSSVLQTAAFDATSNSSFNISFYLGSQANQLFSVVLHFAEVQTMINGTFRDFYVYINGNQYGHLSLESFTHVYAPYQWSGYFDASLVSTGGTGNLPPILNAYEIFEILPVIWSPTDNIDVTAMNTTKAAYLVTKDWSGDPCVPSNFTWAGINCTNDSSGISRITALDLSSSGITGPVAPAFGGLTKLKKLNLSNNTLSGYIPHSLSQLTMLEFLDLSGNNGLVGELPPGLIKRYQDGHLLVNVSGTRIVIEGQKSSKVVILVSVAAVLVFLLGGAMVLFILYKRKHKKTDINPHTSVSIDSTGKSNFKDSEKKSNFERKQFSFEELELITNNFHDQIGIGGFGKVFKGWLENGTEVAVKVHSELSSQGVKQYSNEVENLSRVHHKNLVSLLGYYEDNNHLALVYEYMQGGNLQDWITGKSGHLDWKQRLQIAYESAQGLEYLHKMCHPPLIHRDVKTTNILLTANLEAKISDFGLVRAFSTGTHVSTQVVGTPGYLDLNYASSSQLTEKSDVYSFGVVLLEIITGRSSILESPQMGQHLTQFVQQRLSKGYIESVIDPKIGGPYNINAIWKVADLALRCTAKPAKRPDMTTVVTELKDSLDLEISSIVPSGATSSATGLSTEYSRNDSSTVGVIHNSDVEIAKHIGGMLINDSGPSTR